MTSVQEPEIENDGLFKGAAISGRYGKFALDNVSYYPSQRVQRSIGYNIFGVDIEKKGLFGSEKYREIEGRGGLSPAGLIIHPLKHTDVEGDFLLLENGDLYLGLLDMRRVLDEYHPEINLSIVSPRALFPSCHQIERIAAGSRPSFYTVDEDGSKWSLHCK